MARKDNSKRTSRIRTPYVLILVSLVTMLIGVVGLGAGFLKYNDVVAHSSTAKGTAMTFQRSDATVYLDDIYTDEAQSVLIARLSGSTSDMLKLPYRGSSYAVIAHCDGLKTESGLMPILFGKMSTDGDMFLIIPMPAKSKVYDILIVNTEYVAYSADSSNRTTNYIDDPELYGEEAAKALIESISSYNYNDRIEEGGSIEILSNAYDAIGFRLALNPGLDDEAYRPKVIPGCLRDPETAMFDFKTFFNEVFKQNVPAELASQYADIDAQIDLLEVRRTELRSRLSSNASDVGARNALNDVEAQISTLQARQESIALNIERFNKLEYSEGLFSNLQDTAYVVDDLSKL